MNLYCEKHDTHYEYFLDICPACHDEADRARNAEPNEIPQVTEDE